jgi:hypothetical protein
MTKVEGVALIATQEVEEGRKNARAALVQTLSRAALSASRSWLLAEE